jgi:hypothetical protein
MTRVYVAGKFEEKPEVRRVQDLVRAAGHTVSCDWTVHDDSGVPADERAGYLQRCAQEDWSGVERADAVLVLNHPNLHGGMLEVGLALAGGRDVLLVGRPLRDSIFFYLPEVRCFDTAEQAVEAL